MSEGNILKDCCTRIKSLLFTKIQGSSTLDSYEEDRTDKAHGRTEMYKGSGMEMWRKETTCKTHAQIGA